MKPARYDLAIIGAGAAGLIAADFARKLGVRVALLERDRIGGDCTWTGCVPSKSLLRVAKAAHEMRTAARFGLAACTPVADMPLVRSYVRSTIDDIYAGTTPEALRAKGIDVLIGPASFTGAHDLVVGEQRIRAHKVIIGTGAQPVRPHIAGIDMVRSFTYRDVFENDHLPKHLCVIGGGPIGVEVAQAYARLGADVTLFAQGVLAKEEPEAQEIVERVLEREGVRVVGDRVRAVEAAGTSVVIRTKQATVTGDMLLVATGRRPVVDGLGLDAAGVRYCERGIEVNDRLQTSTPNIYAAGDVIGGPQYSHLAGWQGFQAARNALLPGKASGHCDVMPRVTFCDPEVAQVGQTEAQARAEHGRDVCVRSWPIVREDRAVCDDDRDGLIKVIASRNGKILGATIVGHRAGEAIVELVLAMSAGLSVTDIARTVHPYPTYASAIQLLASDMAVERAVGGVSGAVVRALARLKRYSGR